MGRRWLWLIRVLSIGVGLGAVLNLIAAVYGVAGIGLLDRYGLTPPTVVLAALDALWAFLLFACALGLWRIRRWGRRLTLGVMPIYSVFWLGMQWVFGRSDFAQVSWPFAAARLALLVATIWIILNLPPVRRRFEMTTAERSAVSLPRSEQVGGE